MYDSYSDHLDRSRGINPMNKEYQEEVNKKRNQLLNNDSISPFDFCLSETQALLAGEKTSYTDSMLYWLKTIFKKEDEVKRLIDAQSLYAPGIDPENPNTWSETMIKNLYKLEEAAALWELDDLKFSLEEFKHRLLSDLEFRKFRKPKKGMEREGYS